MSDFILSPAARDDLIDIWEYIAAHDLDTADRIRDEIFAAIDNPVRMPEMGHLREDLVDEPLRFWRVYNYLIIYRRETKPLEVVRVVSGYRDIRSLFGG